MRVLGSERDRVVRHLRSVDFHRAISVQTGAALPVDPDAPALPPEILDSPTWQTSRLEQIIVILYEPLMT